MPLSSWWRGKVWQNKISICRMVLLLWAPVTVVQMQSAPCSLSLGFPEGSWLQHPHCSVWHKAHHGLWIWWISHYMWRPSDCSQTETWVQEAPKPALLFFFFFKWGYWYSSKNHTNNLIYYGRDGRKFKLHVKNWWGRILLCSETASTFVLLTEITLLAGMLAAQLRPQLFLCFCITVCCDVAMGKPAQLLVTVRMSWRILENICAFASFKLLKWLCSAGTECHTDVILQPAWSSG